MGYIFLGGWFFGNGYDVGVFCVYMFVEFVE